MGECQIKPHNVSDFGDRKFILDIQGNDLGVDTKDEADPTSIINGGPGVPVIKP